MSNPDDRRRAGLALAGCTAAISGVAVYLNGRAVQSFADPTAWTTLKNLVAGVLIATLLAVATARRSPAGFTPPRRAAHWAGLAVVVVLGGAVPFVLFFEGLAQASATDAAFIHKTLVIWVAVAAVPLLGERLGPPHLVAVAALVAGQALLGVDLSSIAAGSGEAMIMAATLLWAVEVVVAKRLVADLSPLTVGTARLALGSLVLVGWVVATGRFDDLVPRTAEQWMWALASGALLCGYVTTWLAALARAQAIDVTAVLVVGAGVTVGLGAVLDGAPLAGSWIGLGLVMAGTAVMVLVPPPDAGHPVVVRE